MQKSKNHTSINKAARQDRKDPDPGKGRAGQNGSEQRGAAAAGITGPRFHLLEKELRTLPLFELAMLNGDDMENKFPGLMQMVNKEAKQLQAIEDLYRIVKAQPKYKQLKDATWKADTPPIRVIMWLLRKLGPLAGGASWTVDTYKQGGKTRYRFVIYKDYHRQDVGHREEYLPLDFLPRLKKRDEQLHDMMIDTVALVSRNNKIPLWDEDGDFSEMLKDLLQVPRGGYDVHRLKVQHQIYCPAGIAGKYLKLIKQTRKTVSISGLAKKVAAYDAKSYRKQCAISWIKRGIRLAETKENISPFSYHPNYLPGDPVSAEQQYKFIWSHHSNDILKIRAFHKLKKAAEKYGDYYPLRFSIAKPGQVLKPLPEANFPGKLYDFLDFGVKHFCYTNRQYYYGEAFNKDRTPSEEFLEPSVAFPAMNLLNAIEIAQIRQQS